MPLGRRRGPGPGAVRISAPGRSRGRALLSYLAVPNGPRLRDRRLRGHSNQWESRQIARTLARLGFTVDVVDFRDDAYRPEHHYDVVMAIDGSLRRLAEDARADLSLLHVTGAFPRWHNEAERRRLAELAQRRGAELSPRRRIDGVDAYEDAIRTADRISLIGNDWTRSTFPATVLPRMTCVPVSVSAGVWVKPPRGLVPPEREFLWFFGSGAVHKGLDRALEAFAATPDLTLNVVGNIAGEADFVEAYQQELFELPNIRFHGFLDPAGAPFRTLASRCFCVVSPSCSEGTSPATAGMLQTGLLPLISRETGITLPDGAGRYLETSSVQEIREQAAAAHRLSTDELRAQITVTQRLALERYSRAGFALAMRSYLQDAVG